MKAILQKYQWILVLLVAVVGGGLCMDLGHEWGDDFALYLDQARCWVNGGMVDLYATNKVCMDESDGLVGPYLYPQGFPLFLSFFIRLFSLIGIPGLWMIMALKWANYIVFLLVLVVYLRLLNVLFEGRWGHIFLAFVLIAWHPKFWEAADRITSDLWFTGLVILFFYALLVPFKGWFSRALTLSLLVLVATATRSNGVFLLAAWVVFEWLAWRKEGLKDVSVVSIVMGTTAALFALYADAGNGSNHWQLLKDIEFKTIWTNLGTYITMAGSAPFWHVATALKLFAQPLLWLGVLLVWVLVFIGAVKGGRMSWVMVVFVGLNFVLYVVWPSVQGMRFLFPLLPFIMVFLVRGLAHAWQAVILPQFDKVKFLPQRIKSAQFWVIAGAGFMLLQGAMTSVFYLGLDTNLAYSKEMMGVYGFVEQQVQTTKRVSFHKPRLMRYATGVEAFKTVTNFGVDSPSDEAENQMTLEQAMHKLKSNRIDYWILSKSQLVRTALPALPVAYENEGYVVYDVSQPLPLNTKSR